MGSRSVVLVDASDAEIGQTKLNQPFAATEIKLHILRNHSEFFLAAKSDPPTSSKAASEHGVVGDRELPDR